MPPYSFGEAINKLRLQPDNLDQPKNGIQHVKKHQFYLNICSVTQCM